MIFRILIFLFCLSVSIFSNLPKDLDLEATYIRYINNNKILIASENVILKYEDFTVTSDYFIYDIEHSLIEFPKSLNVFNQEHTLHAGSLNFNFKKKKGFLTNFSIFTNDIIFKSESVKLSLEDIKFKNAYFTKCFDHPHHYYFTSKSLKVFPVVGYLTARQNRFKFKYLPFSIPIPFYFYGSPNNSILNNNPYLPEIGINQTEGFFVTYKTTYIPTYKSTGSFDFGYTEKLNYTLGGSNFYNQNDKLNHGIKYKFYPNNGFSSISYHSKYSISLENTLFSKRYLKTRKRRRLKKELNFLDVLIRNFRSNADIPVLDADFSIQKNTLINDFWVSHYPKLTLSGKNLPSSKYIVDVAANYAYTIEEDSNTYSFESSHFQFLNSVRRKYPLVNSLNLHTSLLTNINIYKDSTYWKRIFFIISLEKDLFFNPKLSLYQKLYIDGSSPFQHQSSYAVTDNEIGLSIHETFNNIKISSEMFYKLDTLSFRELNISIFKKYHCWGNGFSWSVKRNSFNILFSFL